MISGIIENDVIFSGVELFVLLVLLLGSIAAIVSNWSYGPALNAVLSFLRLMC